MLLACILDRHEAVSKNNRNYWLQAAISSNYFGWGVWSCTSCDKTSWWRQRNRFLCHHFYPFERGKMLVSLVDWLLLTAARQGWSGDVPELMRLCWYATIGGYAFKNGTASALATPRLPQLHCLSMPWSVSTGPLVLRFKSFSKTLVRKLSLNKARELAVLYHLIQSLNFWAFAFERDFSSWVVFDCALQCFRMVLTPQ